MTIKEAIRRLCVYSDTNGSGQCTTDEHKAAKMYAIRVLEMRIPKRPLDIEENHKGLFGDCPNCKRTANDLDSPRYCRHCGQALNWWDLNEETYEGDVQE